MRKVIILNLIKHFIFISYWLPKASKLANLKLCNQIAPRFTKSSFSPFLLKTLYSTCAVHKYSRAVLTKRYLVKLSL